MYVNISTLKESNRSININEKIDPKRLTFNTPKTFSLKSNGVMLGGDDNSFSGISTSPKNIPIIEITIILIKTPPLTFFISRIYIKNNPAKERATGNVIGAIFTKVSGLASITPILFNPINERKSPIPTVAAVESC